MSQPRREPEPAILDWEAIGGALAEMDQEVHAMLQRQAEVCGHDQRSAYDQRTHLAAVARRVAQRLNTYADVLELFQPHRFKDS